MDNEASIAAAHAVMADHISALNNRDEGLLAATLHFPHYRLSGSTLKCWETPDAYFEDFRCRAGGDWSHSSADDIRMLAATGDKVHLDVEINRFNTKGDKISSFRALWVMTSLNGVWAAQFRSSFAAK
ncbi:MAG: hypothetical protein MK180_14730 [Rhodobacteraceae bacterium]|nr:hypothetical protein [Paracoccaceae bacterium]